MAKLPYIAAKVMRQAFSHFWRICNAVRVIQGLNNFLVRLKSEEAVEAPELRDFVHVLDG